MALPERQQGAYSGRGVKVLEVRRLQELGGNRKNTAKLVKILPFSPKFQLHGGKVGDKKSPPPSPDRLYTPLSDFLIRHWREFHTFLSTALLFDFAWIV